MSELCWKPVGECIVWQHDHASGCKYEHCDRWAEHTGPCLATCGDCTEGRCHIPVKPPRPGVGDPTCGCARHADSLLARRLDRNAADA